MRPQNLKNSIETALGISISRKNLVSQNIASKDMKEEAQKIIFMTKLERPFQPRFIKKARV